MLLRCGEPRGKRPFVTNRHKFLTELYTDNAGSSMILIPHEQLVPEDLSRHGISAGKWMTAAAIYFDVLPRLGLLRTV